MSDPFDDYSDDDYVAGDFHSLVGLAQYNELVEVEKQREAERKRAQQLREESASKDMTLMQIAGLKSQKEIDKETALKDAADQKRDLAEQQKRKDIEHAKLRDQFPPPNITDS